MAGDDPPFLPVGTEVSAKYRGAFCEAKVKKIVKSVKCKIYVRETLSSVLITDDLITKGQLKAQCVVEFKHPDNGQLMEGVVNKLTDCSMYTVVFDDGDEKTLRRTQCVLKGEKHFIESETLDNLPLSNPEHFGTPVMQNKVKRRLGRSNIGMEEESDNSSSDESIPKRATYKGRNQELVGKLMMGEIGEKKKQTVPVLVVLPDAHSTELKTKDHILVKSFKDGKFYSFLRKELKDFSKPAQSKFDDKNLKTAIEKALAYHDNEELPSSWERDELLGTDEEDDSDLDVSSDDETNEEKDHFVAQLYKFMDDRGTPINKGPYIGNKDLNLHKLFRVVQNIGGYNKVTNLAKWRAVYKRMDLPPSNTASHQIKNAYKKYLHAFEDFYRKLGSSMGTISRPGRSRHSSGRGIIAFRGKEGEKTDKGTDVSKEEGKGEESEGEEEDKTVKKTVTTPKRERLTRRDLGDLVKEGREKRDGSKDSRLSDKLSDKRSPARKEEVKKEEVVKKAKVQKKEEVKEAKSVEETEEKNKKVNRRRSLRKEELKKEEEGEQQNEEKKQEKDVKQKGKAAEKKEKKEEKEEKPVVKKEEKKEDTKASKAKVVKKEAKKESEAEVEPKKAGKKDSAKKAKEKEEESEKSTKKKKSAHVEETNEEEEEEEDEVESKVVHHSEYSAGTKLQVKYGRGKNHKVYDAKIVESQMEGGQIQYLVHYAGWNVRYDEWIRPDRIVAITSKPEPVAKKKLEIAPKSPKGNQGVKKSKASTPHVPLTPIPVVAGKPVAEGRPIKRSPAHVTTTATTTTATKTGKPRTTRSNSVDVKAMEAVPGKRRKRKSSGLTESSDVLSQGSVSDLGEDMDIEADKESRPSETSEPIKEKAEVSKASEDEKEGTIMPEIHKETVVAHAFESDKTVEAEKSKEDDESGDVSDLSAVEQDLLNKAAEIQKIEDSAIESAVGLADEKQQRESEELALKNKEVDNLESKQAQLKVSLEDIVKKEQVSKLEEIDLNTTQTADQSKEQEMSKEETGKTKEDNSVKAESQSVVDDRFEFKDEEENDLAELLHEKEVKEKTPKEKSKEKEKTEGESEKKVTKGRKKEPVKSEKKDNQPKETGIKREVKRGRPSLADKRAAEEQLQMQLAKESAESAEPPNKKIKEEIMDKEKTENVDSDKGVKDLEGIDYSSEEMKKEENEVERKKVKKKVKKKDVDISESATTKDTAKTVVGKGAKGEKVCNKGKGKKLKDLDAESEMKALELGAVESLGRLGELDTSKVTNTTVATSSSVIKSDTSKSVDTTCNSNYSATDILLEASSKDLGANSESKLTNQDSHLSSKEQAASNSALYDNTPPTTPEHDGEDASSQEHSQDSISSSNKMANIHIVNERQYDNESPTGNASPSSNDGSIGSGNVACSESSNNEGVATTSLGKRRHESEDNKAAKRRRRGKSKQERKTSVKPPGSDSDETCSQDHRFSPDPGTTSPTKSHRSHSPRTPKYHLNLEEGKYLEGEKRISFLMEKIQEIRKIYMNLKSEVACIDRRRKRARRKERDSAQNSSGGTGCEGEMTR